MKIVMRGVWGLLAVFLLFASPVLAQQNVSDDQVNEVAGGLYCPVCESTPLDVCPTQACADWRDPAFLHRCSEERRTAATIPLNRTAWPDSDSKLG